MIRKNRIEFKRLIATAPRLDGQFVVIPIPAQKPTEAEFAALDQLVAEGFIAQFSYDAENSPKAVVIGL